MWKFYAVSSIAWRGIGPRLIRRNRKRILYFRSYHPALQDGRKLPFDRIIAFARSSSKSERPHAKYETPDAVYFVPVDPHHVSHDEMGLNGVPVKAFGCNPSVAHIPSSTLKIHGS